MKTCSTCYAYQGAATDLDGQCINLDSGRLLTGGQEVACGLWSEVVPMRNEADTAITPLLSVLLTRKLLTTSDGMIALSVEALDEFGL